MIHLFEGVPSDGVTLLLLDTLAQVTAIALLALLVMRTVARRSPAARHGIALCALFCVLSSPAIAGSVERVGRPESGALSWTSPTAVIGSGSAHGETVEVVPQTTGLHPVTGALVLIWAAGVGWQVVRFVAGCGWLIRLRKSVSPVSLDERACLLEEVRRVLGRRRFPAICASTLVRGPVVLGPFSPMIVLPAGMAESLEDCALRDVLIHECAHLVQNHHVLGCAQRWIAILFWPHPLVHALCRELGQSAEELCDNFVLRHSEAPQYARTLLTVATTGKREAAVGKADASAGQPPFSSRYLVWRFPAKRPSQSGRLMARVEGLLDRRRERRTQWDLWKQVVLTSMFLAVATSVSAMRVSQAAARPEMSTPARTTRSGIKKAHDRKASEQIAPPVGRCEVSPVREYELRR